MTPFRIFTLLVAAMSTRCATTPSGSSAPHSFVAKVSEVPGLTIFADTAAWNGEPENLSAVFVPVWISIEYQSGAPLKVVYGDFALAGSSGRRYPALPKAALNKSIVVPSMGAQPDRGGGSVALVVKSVPFDLPTPDMIEKSLRVGADGRGAGFLYFNLSARNESSILFELTVLNAETREPLARPSLPVVIPGQESLDTTKSVNERRTRAPKPASTQ